MILKFQYGSKKKKIKKRTIKNNFYKNGTIGIEIEKKHWAN